MGEERNVYKILVENPEGKRPLGRPRHRWKDGIQMDLVGDWPRVWNVFKWLILGAGGRLF
jgi:hypothetical protein